MSTELATLLRDTTTYILNRPITIPRYRDGMTMVQVMRVDEAVDFPDAVKIMSEMASRSFPSTDKFELTFHLTADQLERLSELLRQ